MDSICTACFCSGRKLVLLSETGLSNVYDQILNEISVSECPLRLSMRVCWECKALLRRFQRFRVQAQRCYTDLLECLHQDSKTPSPRPPHLQLHHAHIISFPHNISAPPIKEEHTDLEDVKSEEYVHDEPETFVKGLDFDKIESEEKIGVESKSGKEKQTTKKKGKKKVKLKKKTKKPPSPIEPPLSDGLSDREFENGGDVGLIEDRLEEKVADVDVPEASVPNGGTKLKRRPRSKEVLPDKPTCPDCGKTFSSRKTYRYHRNVLHKGQNRYPCPRCGRVYQWKSNLGRHMRTHKARDTGELYCEKCDKSFASVATYRQHLRISRRHVPESDYTFMCNECGKKFVDKTRLRDHIDWEHLKHIKYRCHICNNAFKCHTTLYVHMQNIHTNKERKDNLCHVCGKSYQNASKLKYHIVAMHTSETPHRCVQCGAAFGWYSSLYRHVREVHYGMKVPARNVKKSKKLLRELLMHPDDNPPIPQPGPP